MQLIAHLFGDYIFQSDWMAQNKAKRSWPAFVHALLYSLCFLPLCWMQGAVIGLWADANGLHTEYAYRFHWTALLVIFGTHFLIDRFRLARYVVWAKNWIGLKRENEEEFLTRLCKERDAGTGPSLSIAAQYETPRFVRINPPLSECPTAYPPSTPIWLTTWLLIVADNSIHLAINWLALKYL